MSKEFKEKEQGRLSKMYGNFVQIPYVWYKLCRKYEIPKEIVTLKNKDNTIELNPMEINVLSYLAGYKDCYPSNKQMASLFQVGNSTIEKYLKELRWVGFIKTFEEKSSPTHTEKRKIYVQYNVIDEVLKSENNPYKCMVHNDDNPYECMDEPIQTNGTTHTDVGDNPYECMTNNKALESIIKHNKEPAIAEIDFATQTDDNGLLERQRNYNFKSKSSLSNEYIRETFDNMIDEMKQNGDSYEKIINSLKELANSDNYKCDIGAVTTYANSKLIKRS